MKINKILAKGSLALGSLLVFALPALPDTITFAFSNTGSTGSSAATGASVNGSDQLTGFVGTVSTITATGGSGLGGATDVLSITGKLILTSTTAGNGSQDSYVLNGTVSCLSCSSDSSFTIGTATNLLTIIENASTSNGTGANSVITFGAVTNLTSVNASLASFLGIGSSQSAALAGTGNNATLGSGSTQYTTANGYTPQATQAISSETYAIQTTPEPASFLLFGTGLVCAGLISRRRRTNKS